MEGALANFAEALGMCEREWGKVLQPVVLTDCRAKAMCVKKQVSVDLIFGYFPSRESNKASAAIERPEHQLNPTYA